MSQSPQGSRSTSSLVLPKRVFMRRPNSNTAFDRLPGNIILTIFETVLSYRNPSVVGVTRYDDHHRLGEVCQSWWNLVYRTPGLWKEVNTTLPLVTIHRLLALCPIGPLDVEIRMPTIMSAEFVGKNKVLDKHRNRWNSLVLYAALDKNQTLRIFRKIAAEPAPELKKVDIRWIDPVSPWDALETGSWDNWAEGDIWTNLFGGRAPKLKEIALTSVPVAWDPEIFSDLTSLRLKYYPRQGRLTQKDLYWMLTSSPKLRVLDLERVEFADSGTEEQAPTQPMSLPYLQSLRLGCFCSPQVYQLLLVWISAHNRPRIDLEVSLSPVPALEDDNTSLPPIEEGGYLSQQFERCSGAQMDDEIATIVFTDAHPSAGASTPGLLLDLPGWIAVLMIQRNSPLLFLNHCSPPVFSNIIVFDWKASKELPDIATVRSGLSHLTRVEILRLSCATDQYPEAIFPIHYPYRVSPSHNPVWIFPSLRQFHAALGHGSFIEFQVVILNQEAQKTSLFPTSEEAFQLVQTIIKSAPKILSSMAPEAAAELEFKWERWEEAE